MMVKRMFRFWRFDRQHRDYRSDGVDRNSELLKLLARTHDETLFEGDTLSADTEVLVVRESRSRPG